MPVIERKSETYQPTLFSVVRIMGKAEPQTREFLVNYSDHETKVWFTKTMIWALTNERTISITRASTKDIESRQLFTPRT